MSPILQSRANASAIGYGAFFGAAAAGSFESIATVTVGSGGASSITFSSIPATYTHLQIRYSCVSNNEGYGLEVLANSDTGANYSWHRLSGSGSTAAAGAGTSASMMELSYTPDATYPLVGIIDALDYANSNKYKTFRSLSGYDKNGSGYILFNSGSWRNTNAITSITIQHYSTNVFNQYSHFALYGIKAA